MTIAEQIPILKAEHMYQGGFDGPNKSHCLLGHQMALCDAVRLRMYLTLQRMTRRSGHDNVAKFNDAAETRTELADFWNKARRRVIQNEWRKNR